MLYLPVCLNKLMYLEENRSENSSQPLQTSFKELSQSMIDTLQPDEQLSLTLEAEDSLYIRLNESKVRHVFTVEQGNLILSFMKTVGQSFNLYLLATIIF